MQRCLFCSDPSHRDRGSCIPPAPVPWRERLKNYIWRELQNPGRVMVVGEWKEGNSFQYAAVRYVGWRSYFPYVRRGPRHAGQL